MFQRTSSDFQIEANGTTNLVAMPHVRRVKTAAVAAVLFVLFAAMAIAFAFPSQGIAVLL